MPFVRINIAEDFSRTPGARYRDDGPYSAQEFRENFLDNFFVDKHNDDKIEINLDGTAGYATSFLDGVFGHLAREYGKERVIQKICIVSKEAPLLKDEIMSYINYNE